MTTETALAEIAALDPQERELWKAVQAIDAQAKAARDAWSVAYNRIASLRTFVEMSQAEVEP